MSENSDLNNVFYKKLFNQLSNQLGSNQLFSELCNVYSSSFYSPDEDSTDVETNTVTSAATDSTSAIQSLNNQLINNSYAVTAASPTWATYTTISPEAEQAAQITALQIEIANMKQTQTKLEETVKDLKSILKIIFAQLNSLGT